MLGSTQPVPCVFNTESREASADTSSLVTVSRTARSSICCLSLCLLSVLQHPHIRSNRVPPLDRPRYLSWLFCLENSSHSGLWGVHGQWFEYACVIGWPSCLCRGSGETLLLGADSSPISSQCSAKHRPDSVIYTPERQN